MYINSESRYISRTSSIQSVFNQSSVALKNTKRICSTLGVPKISRASIVSNLLSVPMKHNKFISNVSSVSNSLLKPLSVSRLVG